MFDPADILALFGEADGRELLRLADVDLRTRLDALRLSLAGSDRTAAARAAHSIAGVSGTVMALTLSDLARELEVTLKAPGADVPGALVERLLGESSGVLDAMARYASSRV